jgi:23S rRNA (cytosine1962-C5)-methyltransferase
MTKPVETDAARRGLLLKRGREGAVRNRHPWLFTGAIERETGPETAPFGDLLDSEGAVIASGFYSLHSQIRLRVLTYGARADEALLRERVAAAVRKRNHLRGERTTALRLIHSEGDDLSGVIVDLYGDVAVVQIANRGAETMAPVLVDELRRHVPLRGV